MQRAFLAAYSKTGSVTRAAIAADVDRRTHVNWLKAEGDAGERYREAFAEAREMAADLLEDEARRRAVTGLVRYRFTKSGDPLVHPKTGEPYYELEYSDALLSRLLDANLQEKFRKRVEHSGEVNGHYDVVIASAKDTLARKLARLAEPDGAAGVPGQPES